MFEMKKKNESKRKHGVRNFFRNKKKKDHEIKHDLNIKQEIKPKVRNKTSGQGV